MTQRVVLSEEDFRALVSGEAVKTRSFDGVEVEILLLDMGVRLGRAYFATIQDGYQNARWPERKCDHCGKPYRGMTVYCSLDCALEDR